MSGLKSEVMRKAWKMFRGTVRTYLQFDFNKFSDCLKRAWQIVKQNIAYKLQQEAEKAEIERLQAWWATDEYKATPKAQVDLSHYYNGNTYNGD